MFFIRRKSWTLTLRGKLLALAVVVAASYAAIVDAYPFLAVSHPVPANILIVEGWIPTYSLNQAADEFRRGHYQKLLIVCSSSIDGREYEAIRAAVMKSGVPAESVETIYYPVVRKDRTYHTALAAKNWLEEHELPARSINVVTVGPHARRSWLTFEKAFGNSTAVGVIALDDQDYDPQHWWRTSEGVRELLGETIAYVYAKFFFAWK